MRLSLPLWAVRGLQLLLTLALTWLILRGVGVTLDEVRGAPGALPPAHPGWLFGSGLLLLLSFLLAGRSWGWMVRDMGGRDPGALASLRVVLLSNLGRYLPGKLWQIAGLALLGRRAGVPATIATASGVLVQCFALAAAALASLPALLRSGEESRTLFVSAGILILFVGAASAPPIVRGALGLIFRIARLPAEDIPRGSPSFGPRWLGWHLFIWGMYGISFLLLLRSVGVQGDPLFFASAFASAYLIGYLALFAPAGVGVREGVLVALLRPELGGSAIGIALLARVWITLVELLPAGVLALYGMSERGGERV